MPVKLNCVHKNLFQQKEIMRNFDNSKKNIKGRFTPNRERLVYSD